MADILVCLWAFRFPGDARADKNVCITLPDFFALASYQALINLPFHHRDPFDSLLIAQAQVEKLTLITCDSESAAYDVPLLW